MVRFVLILMACAWPLAAAAQDAPPSATEEQASLEITSPLGRTGAATRLRIVAQAEIPFGKVLSSVSFYVDGEHIGTVDSTSGPPYSVDWVDSDPFARREIVVQAGDWAGRVIRDSVILEPFEVVDLTEVTSVLVETSVYDTEGQFVRNFDPSLFAVRENDVEQKIDMVSREATPTSLVLLIDNSQSMHRRMEFLRAAAGQFVEYLNDQDSVVVAPFNTAIGAITGPTRDRETVEDAISNMRAEGGTAILDALVDGTKLLAGLEGRHAVVLLTDGYDENSKAADADAVIRAANEVQATIYVVGIGGVAGISLRGERTLRALAERTGGRVFFPPRERDLIQVADDVATDTHNRYLIAYTPTNQEPDGTWRDISVEVPEGLRTVARPGYFAPSPPPIRPMIEFTVTDGSREFVDITASELEVFEEGVTQTVDTFQEAVDPVSIVMALDSSGSMKNRAEQVKQTATDFVTQVRPEDKLALITFADRPMFAHTLSTNREFSYEAIGDYVAVGGTALYDALFNSLMTLKPVEGRRAVIVLSDGKDENNPGTAPGSIHTFDEVLELSRDVGAAVYAIGIGNIDRGVLEMLTATTGGALYIASDTDSLGEQFRRVIESLRRRYVLSYVSTNSTRDGRWREVQIRPTNPEHVISMLGGYFAPQKITAARTRAQTQASDLAR
jgi:VWFA-related protein